MKSRYLALALCAGCASGDDTTVEPAPSPENVITFEHHEMLEPGGEFDHCKFVQIGPEGAIINRAEVDYTPGSHHSMLYMTGYTSIPTVDVNGVPEDTSKVLDCHDGKYLRWDVKGTLVLAQPSDQRGVMNLPEGVGIKLEPNAVLLYSVHQINSTETPAAVDNKITLHTIPADELVTEAGVMYHYNYYIDVPAGKTSTSRMSCPVPRDVTLASLQSHTHKTGVSTQVDLVDGAGAVMEKLYQNDQAWDNAYVEDYEGGKLLPAGSAIDYHCNFNNTGETDVVQGFRSTDEMCALIGIYYPLDLPFARCNDDGNWLTQSLGATPIGNGAATCEQSAQCLLDANPFLVDFGKSSGTCFVNSCAKAAPALKSVRDCLLFLPADQDPATACAPQLERCAQTAC